MAQPSHPTLINLPPPGSNPDTPSEMPGTPTSTTTSLSALSTTAIKDGHRGHFSSGPLGRGHQHSPSTTSLEAERADRISRLAGLERVSTLRPAASTPPPPPAPAPPQQQPQPPPPPPQQHALFVSAPAAEPPSPSPHAATPTSAAPGFPANYPASQRLTPAYFDSNGQPVAVTKMSTVGSASATEADDTRTTAGDRDEDMLSTDTNYREAGSVASVPDPDPMDEDMDGLATRSVGPYDDRMSDDGSASLVGFGEGAGSTVSGPIYHRRAPPSASGHSQSQSHAWGLERTASGLSDARRDRDTPPAGSASAAQERRDARMVDGVAADPPPAPRAHPAPDDAFVDTTFRGPVPSARRRLHHHPPPAPAGETAESIVQQLDRGEQSVGAAALGSPGRGGEPLGRFYFEGDRKDD